jgi:AcrR family transcriptional regulator
MAKTKLSLEERKKKTIQNAIQLFSQKGFKGATTKKLAQACGISEAMLYKLFSKKDKLYSCIIQHKIADSKDDNKSNPPTETLTPKEIFTTIAKRLLSKLDADPSFMRLLLYSALEEHKLTSMFYSMHIKGRLSLIAKLAEKLEKERTFKHIPPMLCALAFAGMVAHLAVYKHIFKVEYLSNKKMDSLADYLVDIFLSGVLTKPDKNEN